MLRKHQSSLKQSKLTFKVSIKALDADDTLVAAAAVEPLSLNNLEQSRSAAARGARRYAAHSTLI